MSKSGLFITVLAFFPGAASFQGPPCTTSSARTVVSAGRMPINARSSVCDCGDCDGTGRVVGGLGAFFDWAPKAYRPCPNFERSGGQYVGVSGEVGVVTTATQRQFSFDALSAPISLGQAPNRYLSGTADGTGFVSWGGAFVLADLMSREGPWLEVVGGGASGISKTPSTRFSGLEVLELGAGLGLVSLVCGKLGARAIATDVVPDILSLIQRNADENLDAEERSRFRVERLPWGDAAAIESLDFTSPDVVCMADVAYASNRAAWPALVATLQALAMRKIAEDSRLVTKLGEDGDPTLGQPRTTVVEEKKQCDFVVLWAHAARDDVSQVTSPAFQGELLRPLRDFFTITSVDKSNFHPAYRKSNVCLFALRLKTPVA